MRAIAFIVLILGQAAYADPAALTGIIQHGQTMGARR